ncbi:MAG TPA: undecaprenyl-diphosphate phosphatase [Chitinophagaceae bacterium]|nr:undecaprenyl-diphosphate phosphatase [Chitinophagaceae bacterium]
MSLIDAIIIAIVEGLTEFLPISSTGHMIITSYLLGIHQDEFTKLFEVSIQFGAILAVVVLYWKKFFPLKDSWIKKLLFYAKLIVGVIPALLLGFLFSDQIDALLESPATVAVSLLIGGIFLVFADNLFRKHTIESDEQISFPKAFLVGCWQVLAMVPGVSRSAASIIGGMQQKFTRHLAAEFSFFLAVPTMMAATCYTLFVKDWNNGILIRKGYKIILESNENILAFVVGNVVAFVVAMLAIKFFINYLKVHGFRAFGIYRIIAGIIMLVVILSGVMEL